jgi:hypothetical protein
MPSQWLAFTKRVRRSAQKLMLLHGRAFEHVTEVTLDPPSACPAGREGHAAASARHLTRPIVAALLGRHANQWR